jgi:hypothetical protein
MRKTEGYEAWVGGTQTRTAERETFGECLHWLGDNFPASTVDMNGGIMYMKADGDWVDVALFNFDRGVMLVVDAAQVFSNALRVLEEAKQGLYE